MKILVVGSGKLANAIFNAKLVFPNCEVQRWHESLTELSEKTIVIHKGSGRELNACLDFCEKTDSVFIELSTGLHTETLNPNFTLIICPNTSILMLKMLHLFQSYGYHFQHDQITLVESHQSTKTSIPGTAYSIANSLKFPVANITSVRDPLIQQTRLNIPPEYLNKHAYHKISIQDGMDQLSIETKVLGHESYANGVKKIIDVVLLHPLEKRKYSVIEFIDMNLL